jgi:transposase
MLLDWRITPDQWKWIEPHVPQHPGRRTRRPMVDDLRCLEGMLWRLATQARWNDIATVRFASAHACWRRFTDWRAGGALAAIWAAFLSTLSAEQREAWEALVAEKGFAPASRTGIPLWRQSGKAIAPDPREELRIERILLPNAAYRLTLPLDPEARRTT